MLSYRLSLAGHLSDMQMNSAWQQYLHQTWIGLAKISLHRWQFIVRLLLVVCLCFSLSRLFWLLLPSPVVPSAVIAIPTNNDSHLKDTSEINIDHLKSLTLFGKAETVNQANVAASPIDISSAETHLNMILMGVIVSNNEKLARAIISADNKQDVYPIGASLSVGEKVTLAKIMNDRVILNNNGQFESLFLYQDDPHSKPAYTPTSVASPQSQAAMLEWEATHAEPEAPAQPQRPTVYSPDQAITAVGRSMSDVITMNTYNESGKMVGFKISPGRDTEKFKALGLQTNDVVTAINGWPMSNPSQIMEMYQNMGDSSSASLQIKRGGNVVTVDVSLH